MPVTVTTTLLCLRRLRMVLCIVLSTIVINPCLGEEDLLQPRTLDMGEEDSQQPQILDIGEADSHHPPLPDSNLRVLGVGFKNDWKEAKDPVRCMQPCFPFDPVIAGGVSSDRTINYEQDLKLELGQSGPLSFRLTGRHLKMKVEF